MITKFIRIDFKILRIFYLPQPWSDLEKLPNMKIPAKEVKFKLTSSSFFPSLLFSSFLFSSLLLLYTCHHLFLLPLHMSTPPSIKLSYIYSFFSLSSHFSPHFLSQLLLNFRPPPIFTLKAHQNMFKSRQNLANIILKPLHILRPLLEHL